MFATQTQTEGGTGAQIGDQAAVGVRSVAAVVVVFAAYQELVM